MNNLETQTKPDGGASVSTVGLAVESLHIDVRGSEGITFKEGWSTGKMTEPGVQIDTVWYADRRKAFGGCIDRTEATQIRDWLNACIAKWDQEKATANDIAKPPVAALCDRSA